MFSKNNNHLYFPISVNKLFLGPMYNVFIQLLAHYGFIDKAINFVLYISLNSVEHRAVIIYVTFVSTWSSGKWCLGFIASTIFLLSLQFIMLLFTQIMCRTQRPQPDGVGL
ncbi:unnamed protein product [Phytomonas sp. Hart1]|nr:unnamed protein product [Phytomonas sp. Hart1]|eukprot:CCW67950.1 unnamed protein product [Phytomonas sp. isolate Hart1]